MYESSRAGLDAVAKRKFPTSTGNEITVYQIVARYCTDSAMYTPRYKSWYMVEEKARDLGNVGVYWGGGFLSACRH
jgi:hypothetical protein